MGKRIYNKFKIKEKGETYVVVTDDEGEIIIATIPHHIRHKKVVAKAIAYSLTFSHLALTDLI